MYKVLYLPRNTPAGLQIYTTVPCFTTRCDHAASGRPGAKQQRNAARHLDDQVPNRAATQALKCQDCNKASARGSHARSRELQGTLDGPGQICPETSKKRKRCEGSWSLSPEGAILCLKV